MNDLSRPRRPHGPGVHLLVIGASLVLGGLAGAGSAFLGDQPGPVGTAVTAAGGDSGPYRTVPARLAPSHGNLTR